MPEQSTQYNTLADPYQQFYPPNGASSPYAFGQLEEHQLYSALTSPEIDIKGKRVLDFACGTGFYTTRWLTWGAASVVGVDISQGMVDAARLDAKTRGFSPEQIRYQIGDATKSDLVITNDHTDEPLFDIVTGIWLLNYAPDAATMQSMFRTIGANLKPGGVFLGLTIPPLLTTSTLSSTEKDFINHLLSPQGPHGRYGNRGHVISDAPSGDGFKVWIELGLPENGDRTVGFENYYLRREVFEESCRASGLFEGLEWRDWTVSEKLKKERPVGFWNDATLSPHGRVCMARKLAS